MFLVETGEATSQSSLPFQSESSSRILFALTQQQGLGSEKDDLPWALANLNLPSSQESMLSPFKHGKAVGRRLGSTDAYCWGDCSKCRLPRMQGHRYTETRLAQAHSRLFETHKNLCECLDKLKELMVRIHQSPPNLTKSRTFSLKFKLEL